MSPSCALREYGVSFGNSRVLMRFKRADLWVATAIILVVLGLVCVPPLGRGYENFNRAHGLIMAFFKFAVLATLGECLALRIRVGHYWQPGFGLIARAVVWGGLGITIKMAFVVFASGVPQLLEYMGVNEASNALGASALTPRRVLVAFAVSVVMNLVYAPLMMTLHKVSDLHIAACGGRAKALITPVRVGDILAEKLDWRRHWSFVLLRTIPLFWIPAHTVSFLLPPDYQVLYAALLGVALGLILALAGKKSDTRPKS